MNVKTRITPLDGWINSRIGIKNGEKLETSDLEQYQTEKLRSIIKYAHDNSPFYRERLWDLPEDFLNHPKDMAAAPFTSETDVRERSLDMLCVSRGEIARVVTLPSPGAGLLPKRLFFTDDDQEQTMDFFHHGMSVLIQPGSRVLILMPGETPGSIGDLLKKALNRMNAHGFVHGPATDIDKAVDSILRTGADCLAGLPSQVLALARHRSGRDIPPGLVKSVLLSADYVSGAIVEELEARWKAPVFEHYGMTEMGLGGGVQCAARDGYHLREADLYFEVVDPVSGSPAPDGETGEVVFTTLNRRGMPLIRYRTGDLARFLTEPCPCGSSLRRLGKIRGRITGSVSLGMGCSLNIYEMDEILFRIPGLLNYRAEITKRDERNFLDVQVYTDAGNRDQILVEVEKSLLRIESVTRAVANGCLEPGSVTISANDWPTSGVKKRVLIDRRMDK